MQKIYEQVEAQYFDSGDFNGLPAKYLQDMYDIRSDEFKRIILEGINNNVLTARYYDNPHIKAFSEFPSKQKIIEDLSEMKMLNDIVLYPHEDKLKVSHRIDAYKNKPYECELAKGAGQLDYRTFDLSVLEFYRNDPRFTYETDFIQGSICVCDEYYESCEMAESDQVVLKTFGFGYDDDFNRYVVVFLRYLCDLSDEHQSIWKAKEISKGAKMHPDYYRTSIMGDWGTRLSIFQAFVMELELINEMSEVMGRSSLFKHSFCDEMPKKFGFLLRPTQTEFNDFCLLLDQMMSDNINKDFFKNDISFEIEEERKDGKTIVKTKGTIAILEEWILKSFRPAEPEILTEMFNTFRKIRKLRQKPAHAVNADRFDQSLIKMQRELVIESYSAMRTIRQILANHPKVKRADIQISEELYKGLIWDQ